MPSSLSKTTLQFYQAAGSYPKYAINEMMRAIQNKQDPTKFRTCVENPNIFSMEYYPLCFVQLCYANKLSCARYLKDKCHNDEQFTKNSFLRQLFIGLVADMIQDDNFVISSREMMAFLLETSSSMSFYEVWYKKLYRILTVYPSWEVVDEFLVYWKQENLTHRITSHPDTTHWLTRFVILPCLQHERNTNSASFSPAEQALIRQYESTASTSTSTSPFAYVPHKPHPLIWQVHGWLYKHPRLLAIIAEGFHYFWDTDNITYMEDWFRLYSTHGDPLMFIPMETIIAACIGRMNNSHLIPESRTTFAAYAAFLTAHNAANGNYSDDDFMDNNVVNNGGGNGDDSSSSESDVDTSAPTPTPTPTPTKNPWKGFYVGVLHKTRWLDVSPNGPTTFRVLEWLMKLDMFYNPSNTIAASVIKHFIQHIGNRNSCLPFVPQVKKLIQCCIQHNATAIISNASNLLATHFFGINSAFTRTYPQILHEILIIPACVESLYEQHQLCGFIHALCEGWIDVLNGMVNQPNLHIHQRFLKVTASTTTTTPSSTPSASTTTTVTPLALTTSTTSTSAPTNSRKRKQSSTNSKPKSNASISSSIQSLLRGMTDQLQTDRSTSPTSDYMRYFSVHEDSMYWLLDEWDPREPTSHDSRRRDETMAFLILGFIIRYRNRQFENIQEHPFHQWLTHIFLERKENIQSQKHINEWKLIIIQSIRHLFFQHRSLILSEHVRVIFIIGDTLLDLAKRMNASSSSSINLLPTNLCVQLIHLFVQIPDHYFESNRKSGKVQRFFTFLQQSAEVEEADKDSALYFTVKHVLLNNFSKIDLSTATLLLDTIISIYEKTPTLDTEESLIETFTHAWHYLLSSHRMRSTSENVKEGMDLIRLLTKYLFNTFSTSSLCKYSTIIQTIHDRSWPVNAGPDFTGPHANSIIFFHTQLSRVWFTASPNEDKSAECIICYAAGPKHIWKTPCNHVYCVDCAAHMRRKKERCACCRLVNAFE